MATCSEEIDAGGAGGEPLDIIEAEILPFRITQSPKRLLFVRLLLGGQLALWNCVTQYDEDARAATTEDIQYADQWWRLRVGRRWDVWKGLILARRTSTSTRAPSYRA